MRPSILVAGIGNIFNRDDAFGVAVASRLGQMPPPENARIIDFGIRGFDLAMALLEGFDLIIFIDAVSRGESPGTLYLIEHEPAETAGPDYFDNAHGLDPVKVLDMARSLGARIGRVLVVGCEPETLGDETGQIGLSGPVDRAVPEAVNMVLSLIDECGSGVTLCDSHRKAITQ